jgi:CHAT domain/Tetratricopeptide Repeats-Sensor
VSADFAVRGVEVEFDTADGFADLYGADVGLSNTQTISMSGDNRDAARAVLLSGPDDDVIEVEDVDGVVTFDRAGTLLERARSAGLRGLDDRDLTLFLDDAVRGEGSRLATVRRYAVSLPDDIALAVETVDDTVAREMALGPARSDFGMLAGRIPRVVFDPVARPAMRKIADWVDRPVDDEAPPTQRRRRPKKAGLYRVGPELLLEPSDRLTDGDRLDAGEPFLLLLHGTFSHTEAAFGQLRSTAEWESIVDRYPGRVLALEHPTLGRTPAENAVDAARHLPVGARLHLVSHSRGGLVGEVLSYCAAEEPSLQAYGNDPHPDRDALPELRRLLVSRGVGVDRFVRVACPARGTTLASRRLDRWASFLFNVFNLVPVLRETGVAALVKKFLLAMLDQRSDPRVVPGIEAQMPESPFLRMLLGAPQLNDGLGSISGDVQGSSIARRLLVTGADLFYREDHDFVVPTLSMSGGAARLAARTAGFRGTAVHHSAYFGNAESRAALDAWLRGRPGETVAGFAEPPVPRQPRARSRDGDASAEVLLLPDLLGSKLTVDGVPVWPDVTHQVRLGTQAALTTLGELAARDLVPQYAVLKAALDARFAATAWPYDPRRPLAEAGSALASAMRERLGSTLGRPIHLVTHGAGALVALAALRTDGLFEVWRAAGGRAVLLSPPLDGSWLATAHRAGASELCALLALLDRTSTPEDAGQLLDAWPALHDVDPQDTRSVEWRRGLGPAAWGRFSAVYGRPTSTICGIADQRFQTGGAGDGHVPLPRRSAPIAYYATVPNSGLSSDPDVATAVVALLDGQSAAGLLSAAPATFTKTAPLPELTGTLLLPDPDDLVRAAWGGERAAAGRPVLRVCVVHGDVRRIEGAIMVGHQDGTPIAGAERALDERLGGILNRRIGLDAYPGPLGTSEMFGTADSGPAAVVIGLGDAGDLTPAALTAAVTRGVLRLAATHLDRTAPDGPPVRLTLATVLIGTSLIPPMPVDNAVTSLVTGVRHANRRLRDTGELLVVDALQIVEIYEERAIEAVHAAARLLPDPTPETDEEVVFHDRVVDGAGGLRGSSQSNYQEGVWRTVRIVNADPRTNPRPDDQLVELSFTSIGRSARAEQRVNTGQRKLIDALVAEAIGNPAADDQLFNTLYEMLVPNSLKGQGYGGENLMVVVDEQAAILPLEMLATRSQEGRVRPLAVEAGVIRRLETRGPDTFTRQSAGRAALVIGDPPGTGYPRLDAAREEARKVADVLRKRGYHVTAIIPDDDDADDRPLVVSILNALFRRSYRVVHVAGHGNYEPDDPSHSGVVIGPDTFLTALEIAKMRTAPDLVFLNCCHLAAMRPRPVDGLPPRADRLASSISRQLIENGVRAVVAAGWAVNDRAGADFADLLYRRLLEGDDLGTASHGARNTVYNHYRSLNTWGAYQIYGPPAMRLNLQGNSTPEKRPPVGRREFRDALTHLTKRAEGADTDAAAELRSEVESLLDDVPPEWLHRRELAMLGELWAALAVYDLAVGALDQVHRDWSSVARLKDLEKLANAKAKWAVQLAVDGTTDPAAPGTRSLLDEADHVVTSLIGLEPTPERLSLQGSIARRRAHCETDSTVVTAELKRARTAYRRAADLHEQQTGQIDRYAALNAALVGWQVAIRERGTLPDSACTDALPAARADLGPAASFWERVAGADLALAQALFHNELPDGLEKVIELYRVAFTHSSCSERGSVREHIEMIGAALPDGSGPVGKALADLRGRLQ